MNGSSWMRKTLAGLYLCLLSAGAMAWWSSVPEQEPRERYRHLMPTGRDFPGMPRPGAARVHTDNRLLPTSAAICLTLRLDSQPRNRKSTGLYRVPGEPVTVQRTRPGAGICALCRCGTSLIW